MSIAKSAVESWKNKAFMPRNAIVTLIAGNDNIVLKLVFKFVYLFQIIIVAN
jgi:hypothetical protein